MYRATIGLEVHAELATRTKMFCSSKNDPDEIRPNVNVCPVCLAHPGTLPTINREAVLHVLRVGAAIDGTLADYSEFDRKSYFYPDIPKGYQISQYAFPLVSGGTLHGVAITRVHLEEDTARSQHTKDGSLIDFNRAGVPLMELVTEPVIRSAQEAGAFARELQLLLRALGASSANLEKGEMRLEANVSVSPTDALGTKVEVKNLNSFRSLERAISYEIERQTELLESGGSVLQETRGWDEARGETFHQRFKEGSADYRYFPDPDLPKLRLSESEIFSKEVICASLPELPGARRHRYRNLGIVESAVETLVTSRDAHAFFDACLTALTSAKEITLAANYLISDLKGNPATIAPSDFAALIRLTASDALSSRGAKEVLERMLQGETNPEAIVERRGLLQIKDTEALATIVKQVIEEHPQVAEQYRGGKVAVLQFLVGMAMKASRGAGNPQVFKELFETALHD